MNRRKAIFSLGTLAASWVAVPGLLAKELHKVPSETRMNEDHLPKPAGRQGYRVLTDEIARKNLAAVFDRLIPADEWGPSASEAGCIEFIDNELAGDYGSGAALYLSGPFDPDNEKKMMGGPQFISSPRERYLTGLKALETWARNTWNSSFHTLSDSRIDEFLTNMEAGKIDLGKEIDSRALFELMLQNAREGYLADPIHGGNKNMAGWKMIGFPGARYDYRLYIERRNENLNLVPVSLIPGD
ncbi:MULTISPECIES: gluconate 2-dehydrogenase subunit 3 family protein [Azotobacter]|nr:gluconate 2-dehydrogenase subunit 3 family protein [Azotobacter vinelandii]WKN20402.1 gluconate 2-dehydrogenase subunit 3 family protein [Azotobacter vinelandii]SFX26586.1 gluconate 2-dehydrogenase gamma chain [Azotobacter vinelandii]